jgi:hypothetical protein
MGTLVILGSVMMTGMVTGIFVNAGLSTSEIKEKCKQVDDLKKQIENVHKQCDELLKGFKNIEEQEEILYNNIVASITLLKKSIKDMKDKQKGRLNREQYIYTSVLITIISILITKAVLTIFFRDKLP